MRIRAVVLASLVTAACAKLAGIDEYTIGDGTNPTQPGGPRDGSLDEDHILEPGDAGPGRDDGACQQPTNDRFGVLDPRWILRGIATHGTGGVQLTPEVAGVVGQVYWDEALTFDRFEATFKFKIATSAAVTPGDGIAFSWLEGAQVTPIGDAGGAHGIYGKKGFAIIVDTYKNPGDPDVPEVSIRTTDAFVRIAVSAPLPTLTDGAEHEVKARLVGKDVTISVDGQQVLSAPIPNYAPYVGHVSFSAGTGSARSTHTLTEATLRIGSNGPCAPP